MTPIDYTVISEAVEYYQRNGYTYIDVPWFVGEEAINVTLPPEGSLLVIRDPLRRSTRNDRYVVASAEQSYIQMMLGKELKQGHYVTVTPCFRNERELSDSTRFGFMKVELISYFGKTNEDWIQEEGEEKGRKIKTFDLLWEMVDQAKTFMSRAARVTVLPTGENAYDILCAYSDLELGSYGVRTYRNHKWLYGTGVAEPRYSIASNLNAHILQTLDEVQGNRDIRDKALVQDILANMKSNLNSASMDKQKEISKD